MDLERTSITYICISSTHEIVYHWLRIQIHRFGNISKQCFPIKSQTLFQPSEYILLDKYRNNRSSFKLEKPGLPISWEISSVCCRGSIPHCIAASGMIFELSRFKSSPIMSLPEQVICPSSMSTFSSFFVRIWVFFRKNIDDMCFERLSNAAQPSTTTWMRLCIRSNFVILCMQLQFVCCVSTLAVFLLLFQSEYEKNSLSLALSLLATWNSISCKCGNVCRQIVKRTSRRLRQCAN